MQWVGRAGCGDKEAIPFKGGWKGNLLGYRPACRIGAPEYVARRRNSGRYVLESN